METTKIIINKINTDNSGYIGKTELQNYLKTANLDKNKIVKLWNNNWRKYGNKGIPKEKFEELIGTIINTQKNISSIKEVPKYPTKDNLNNLKNQIKTPKNTQNQETIYENKNLAETREYQKSLEIIGEKTLKEVIDYFNIKLVTDIKKLQKKLLFRHQDGIIGGLTLERIFNEIEKQNLDSYPKLKERVELKKEMIQLLKKKGIKVKLEFNPYNHNDYYGYGEKERLKNNEYINKKAYLLLENKNKLNNNTRQAPSDVAGITPKDFVITENIGGTFVTSYYEKNQLKMACLSSPGKIGHQTNLSKIKTQGHESLHISKKYFNSQMFYSINILNGEFYHSGKANGKRKSHGCVRMPIHYAKALFDMTSGANTSLYSFVLDN